MKALGVRPSAVTVTSRGVEISFASGAEVPKDAPKEAPKPLPRPVPTPAPKEGIKSI
jgi:hypothetical protein